MKKILLGMALLSGFLFAEYTTLADIKEQIVDRSKNGVIIDNWSVYKGKVKQDGIIIEDIVLGNDDIIIEDWVMLKSEKDDELGIIVLLSNSADTGKNDFIVDDWVLTKDPQRRKKRDESDILIDDAFIL